MGAEVVSADDVVHRLLREDAEVKSAVGSIFGPRVVAADGSVDRKKLADEVFDDAESLKRLTNLLHPKAKVEIERRFGEVAERGEHEVCVAEVPMLVEEGSLEMYDVIVVVRASYKNQLDRFLRTGGKKADLDRRIRNQADLSEKIKVADFVVDNDGGVEETFRQVEGIYRDICLRGRGRRLSPVACRPGRQTSKNKEENRFFRQRR
jgi:dephospho-CoA kinase